MNILLNVSLKVKINLKVNISLKVRIPLKGDSIKDIRTLGEEEEGRGLTISGHPFQCGIFKRGEGI